MAIPQAVSKSLIASSATVVAASQTPVSGTALALVGGGTVTLDTARRVLLTYGNEGSARTMVITGLNQKNGSVITETLAIPSGGSGTVATAQDFYTVSSALPLGGGWTAAVTVGTNGVGSSPWKNVNYHVTPVNIGLGCVVTGTVNYTVEFTYDRPWGDTWTQNQPNTVVPTAWPHAVLQALAANGQGDFSDPIAAWRLTINSGTGSVTATAIQGAIRD